MTKEDFDAIVKTMTVEEKHQLRQLLKINPHDGKTHNCAQGEVWSDRLNKCVSDIG